MNKNSTFTAIFLGLICLVSILLSQYLWINKTIRLQKTDIRVQHNIDSLEKARFNHQVFFSLSNTLNKIAKATNDSTDKYGSIKQLSNNLFYVEFNGSVNPDYLEKLIEDEFYKMNIIQSFQYSIYDCHQNKIVYSPLINYTIDSLFDKSNIITKHPSISLKHTTNYFTVYFPAIPLTYVAKRETLDSPWLFLIFVSVLTTIYLGYSVFTISKHKKLADIKTDFINNMTHELKTPIATIGLSSSTLLTSDFSKDPERLKRYASIIYTENKRLEAQVERVLNIAKMDKNKEPIKITLFDIHEFILNSKETFEINLEEIGGSLTTRLNAVQHIVYVDPIHIKNVIHNLLENAIKYRKEDRNLQVTIETRNDKKHLIIDVSDNGIGISKENQKFIFEKFYRVSTGDVHDVKGFGLGLFYVHSIIERHGGKVILKSDGKSGSSFLIYLPLKSKLEKDVLS